MGLVIAPKMNSNKDIVIDVGDEVPGFDLDSQLGRIFFREIIDSKWALLLTFCGAFDPVATTDLGQLSKLTEEFTARNIFVCAIGHDTVPNYRNWIKDIEELQSCSVNFALMSDPDCSVLRMFGCARLDLVSKKHEPVSMGLFLIDLDKRVRFSSRTSPFVGRNLYEALRQFDALMLATYHPVVCPTNWGHGQQVMLKTNVSEQDAEQYRYAELRPWFKLTPCPEKS